MSETIINELYEADLYAWTRAQADALRRRAVDEIDWENVAEEIETLGRSDRHQIRSRLEVLLIHLLKWRCQPEWRCGSWRSSIEEQRHRIEVLIEESPSLQILPGEVLAKAYAYARPKALRETGLYRLPEACPWTIEEVLDAAFLPD